MFDRFIIMFISTINCVFKATLTCFWKLPYMKLTKDSFTHISINWKWKSTSITFIFSFSEVNWLRFENGAPLCWRSLPGPKCLSLWQSWTWIQHLQSIRCCLWFVFTCSFVSLGSSIYYVIRFWPLNAAYLKFLGSTIQSGLLFV